MRSREMLLLPLVLVDVLLNRCMKRDTWCQVKSMIDELGKRAQACEV